MVLTAISLDFVPLFFLFFLCSLLEVFLTRTMEDNRSIEIEEHIEHEFENEEDEGEYGEELTPEGDEDEEADEDEEDEDEDEDEDGEDYEDEDEEEGEELIPVQMALPRVSSSTSDDSALQGTVVINEGLLDYSNDSESREGKSGSQENGGGDGGEEELNRGEIDGLFCPICFEAWTNGGEHRICCLPCGHIYGLSCIKKWLQRCRSSGKCPQCKSLCTFKDVRVLYATRLCVADGELYKTVRSLEAKLGVDRAEIQKRMLSIEAKFAECENRMQLLEVKYDVFEAKIVKRMQSFEANFAVADAELQKRVRSLEAKCAYLEQKVASLTAPQTPEELINQISNNPMLVRRLATALAELNQQQDSP